MATVVNITKKALQDLVDQKKTIKEIAEHFSAPKSKIKEGLNHFGIKIPRASKGGVVYNWVNDEEATFTQSETPVSNESEIIAEEAEYAEVASYTPQEEVVLETADNTDF